jgi:hypothetical protein
MEDDLAVCVEGLGAVQLFDATSVARLATGEIPRKAD